MNSHIDNSGEKPRNTAKHGTMKFYIFGFVMSLVFTAIPYYLVATQAVTGRLLLSTIVGFAFMQMAVQLFFFLHLGRGPKPLYNVGFFLGTFGAILVVVGGSIFIMDNLQKNMTPADKSMKLAEDEGIYQVNGEKTGACRGQYTNYKVTISQGIVSPGFINANLCDTITFMRGDETDRDMMFMFGTHQQHANYIGDTELTLRKDRGKTIILGKTGTYQFHDCLNPATAGYFTVRP